MAEKRSCTDVPFLVVFGCLVVAWLSLGIYSFIMGSPSNLTSPKDWKGSRCGIDPHVIGKPLLLYLDIFDCDQRALPYIYCRSPSICVETCPTNTFFASIDAGSEDKPLYCFYDTETYDATKCAKWYVPSVVYKQRCIPDVVNMETFEQINYERNQTITLGKFQNVINRAKFMELFRYYGQHAVYNIIQSWWQFLVTTLFLGIICIMYAFVLGLAPIVIFLFTVVIVVCLLCFGIYTSSKRYGIFRDLENDKSRLFAEYDATIWYITIFILSILLFNICVTLLIHNITIFKTLKITEACGRIFRRNFALSIFPLITWIPKLLVVSYSVVVTIYLETSGNPIYSFKYVTPECKEFIRNLSSIDVGDNRPCHPPMFQNVLSQDERGACLEARCNFVAVEKPASHLYLVIYNCLVALWLIGFFHDLGTMILTYAIANWYWTRFDRRTVSIRKSLVVIKYHLGTIVFGSLIVPFCSNFIMKMMMQFFGKKITQHRLSPRNWILDCMNISLSCVQRATVLISRNGYILCGLKGTNYIQSAKLAQSLLLRNSRVYVPPNIDFLVFAGKLLLTLATGIISYRIFTWELHLIDDTRSVHAFLAIFLTMVCTYITCKSFFSFYEVAIDTAYFCFLVEKEERDDTVDVFSTEQLFEEYFVI